MRKRRHLAVRSSSSSKLLYPVSLCFGAAVTSLVLCDFLSTTHLFVECGAIPHLLAGDGRNTVEPWLPGVFEQDFEQREWTTSSESLHGGTTDGDGSLLDDEVPYWFVGTALPCIHPLDECTFIINGSFPFTGLSSDADERQAVKQTSVVASSSSSSLSPSSAEHDRPDGKLRGETSAARVQRIKEPDNGISSSSNNNDLHVIPEQPEDPCVVSGRVDVPQNWFGYLGVFRLRRSDAPSPASLSPARLYYRVVYPAGRVPVSLLFYLGEQVRSLNVRMNCFQRVQLVDQRGPQVVRLDPGFPQSGCVNRTRTAADAHVTSREDRRTGSDASLSKTVIDCRGGRVLRSNVERQWNIAVSSCGSPRGLTLTYTLAVYGHIGQCPPSPGLSGADCISSTRLSYNELFLSMLLTKFIAMISLSS